MSGLPSKADIARPSIASLHLTELLRLTAVIANLEKSAASDHSVTAYPRRSPHVLVIRPTSLLRLLLVYERMSLFHFQIRDCSVLGGPILMGQPRVA